MGEFGLSVGTCMKRSSFFPYRLTSVHELRPTDFGLSSILLKRFLNTLDSDDLSKNVFFFGDEAYFHGYVNSQNTRMWTSENSFTERPNIPRKLTSISKSIG